MFQTIKSKVTDISNKTDGKISELDQSSDQKWQTLGRLVEDLSNKVETICFPSGAPTPNSQMEFKFLSFTA